MSKRKSEDSDSYFTEAPVSVTKETSVDSYINAINQALRVHLPNGKWETIKARDTFKVPAGKITADMKAKLVSGLLTKKNA